MPGTAYPWTQNILAALYPATCVLCGAPGQGELDLCPGCYADLPHNPHGCPRCALPLPPAVPPGALCGACQRRPPPFDRCIAPLLYAGVVPYLVTGLKFRGRLVQGRLLGALLAAGVAREATREAPPGRIIPVPLHPARMRERGFNQALEIARGPARRLGLPIDSASCVRMLATAPQSGLEAKARRRNLRGAFAVGGRLPECVALVDDVVTTGTTVGELARVLKRAGVRRVEVWAAARTG